MTSGSTAGSARQVAAIAPAPRPEAVTSGPTEPVDPRPELQAVPHPVPIATKLCTDSHPNNPDRDRCRVCDRLFDPAAEVVSMDPAPVGRLLLEDGSAVDVADNLIIGRSPIGDERSDTLTVTGRQVSRRHLVLEARGWELYVKDCDSTNGTFLTRRGEKGRRRVPSDDAIPVRIGDAIHFGARQALLVPAPAS